MRISLRELMIVVAVAAVGLAGLKFASTWMLAVVQAMTGLILLAYLVRAIVDRGPTQAFSLGFVACGIAYLISLGATSAQNATATPVSGLGTGQLNYQLHTWIESPQWVQENTNTIESSFKPTPAELNAGHAVRIELKPLPPDEVSQKKDEMATSESEDAPTTTPTPRRGGRGGGSRGRGGFAPMTNLNPPLTPLQTAEYDSAESYLRTYYNEILATPEGQAAIGKGRPFSSLIKHTYNRQGRPRLADFHTVAYCLWTLAMAYAGGHFARYLYLRRMKQETT